jgi:hypothetical protein
MKRGTLSALTTFYLFARAAALLGATAPEFYKDVVPVLQRHCQSCHRAGEAAPFSMSTYEEVRPWAKAIKAAVLRRTMPPWFADASFGSFKNNPSLSPAEIQTIVSWADGGAPPGDRRAAPPPLNFVEGWNIGKPDCVFEMPVPFNVPANGVLPYQWIVLPTGFKEDKWVTGLEIRPENRRAVHHVVLYYRMPGSSWLAGSKPGFANSKPTDGSEGGGADGFLGGYTPGMPAIKLTPGRAVQLPAGADLVLEMHYTPYGRATTDRTKIGLNFADEKPFETEWKLFVVTHDFVIPPGDPNFRVNAQITLNSDLKLVNFWPHMHLRGKAFEFRAIFPDGSAEMLLRVPQYRFDWQLTYELASERVLPKGTRIVATAYYDNSVNNPVNPNPAAEVRWGDQTWEEMMVGFITAAVPAGADPQTLVSHQPYNGPADPYQLGAQKGRKPD